MDLAHPVLAELLSDTREVVERLLLEDTVAPMVLLAELESFEAGLVDLINHPTADLDTALMLAKGCQALLGQVGAAPEERLLAQVAVRYVVLDEDADGDCDSPYGFDDDVEVFNAVALHLGLAHLALP